MLTKAYLKPLRVGMELILTRLSWETFASDPSGYW